jgi:hypothetical protein
MRHSPGEYGRNFCSNGPIGKGCPPTVVFIESTIDFASFSLRHCLDDSEHKACHSTLPPTTRRSAAYLTQSW